MFWSVGYEKSAIEKLRSSSYFKHLQPAGSYRVCGEKADDAKQDAIAYFRKQFGIELLPADLTVKVVERLV